MYQIKTIVLVFTSVILLSSQSFAHTNSTECAKELMTSEGILNMQNRLRPGTIANDAMIKILNFCAGIYKTSAESTTPNTFEHLRETLDCREDQGCKAIDSNEETEISI